MQWNSVYRVGPMGRKILGNCEQHFPTDPAALAPPPKSYTPALDLATAINQYLMLEQDYWARQMREERDVW